MPHSRSYNRYLRPVFEDRIISRRANVVWPPRCCDLTSLDYYLWGALKDKCYADKPETIDALKDNIREAISEIQHRHRLCAAVFHQWLQEYYPLKRQLSLACRRNTYL